MKKSLLSAVMLFAAWTGSALAVQTPLSAFVRLEDDDSPNSRVHRSYAQVCPERMQPKMCPTGHGFRTAGIGVLPHATHLHAISGHTSAWLRCTRLRSESVSFGHSQIFANDTLEYSAFPGGYFTPKGTFYYITDWQGNNIAVFSGNGSLVQQTTYYPYGEPTIEPTGQRWLFGGKEREHAGGRNSYDYGPRWLATSTGRFTTPDLLTEKRYPISPYTYCHGDPINYIDPSGNIEWPVDETYNGGTRSHENNYNEPRIRNGIIGYHHGVDINIGAGSNDFGAPVYATHDGIVVKVQDYTDGDGGGTRVKIQSKDGKVGTYYMHLNSICDDIKQDSQVIEGQQIGTIGMTGCGLTDKYSPHLHYELFINNKYSDPTNGKNHLIDPQVLINGYKTDNRLYQGGCLSELQVIGPKKDRTIPLPKVDTPQIPSHIQINY